jgi:hypothetical protein
MNEYAQAELNKQVPWLYGNRRGYRYCFYLDRCRMEKYNPEIYELYWKLSLKNKEFLDDYVNSEAKINRLQCYGSMITGLALIITIFYNHPYYGGTFIFLTGIGYLGFVYSCYRKFNEIFNERIISYIKRTIF